MFVRPDSANAVPYLGFAYELDELRAKFREHAEAAAKKAGSKSRRLFRAACKKRAIPIAKQPGAPNEVSAGWVELVTRTPQELPRAAKLFDLTVFVGPLTDYHRLLPNLLECTLLESGHPLLFVPDGSMVLPPARVAIAWDASIQAVRAVGAATPFLQAAQSIHVLSIEEQHEETADPQRLVEYLAWHGLESEGTVVPRAHEQVGRALLAAAQDIEASLLVMGGYAHSRFQEAVFGGTTLAAMRHAPLPLLLMH
jgi:nucleotide-binding universal stress UspA family protein